MDRNYGDREVCSDCWLSNDFSVWWFRKSILQSRYSERFLCRDKSLSRWPSRPIIICMSQIQTAVLSTESNLLSMKRHAPTHHAITKSYSKTQNEIKRCNVNETTGILTSRLVKLQLESWRALWPLTSDLQQQADWGHSNSTPIVTSGKHTCCWRSEGWSRLLWSGNLVIYESHLWIIPPAPGRKGGKGGGVRGWCFATLSMAPNHLFTCSLCHKCWDTQEELWFMQHVDSAAAAHYIWQDSENVRSESRTRRVDWTQHF